MMAAKTILILEPNDTLRALYKEELEEEGYHVAVARDDTEALKILETACPDLVVAEYCEDQATQCVSLPTAMLRGIAVIIHTGFPPWAVFRTWCGEAHYVSKRSDLSSLKRDVRRLLARKRRTKGTLRPAGHLLQ